MPKPSGWDTWSQKSKNQHIASQWVDNSHKSSAQIQFEKTLRERHIWMAKQPKPRFKQVVNMGRPWRTVPIHNQKYYQNMAFKPPRKAVPQLKKRINYGINK